MKRRITRPGKSLVLALALGMMPAALFSAPASAQIAIDIGVRVGPPIMPVYLQPPMPGPNYMWIPGYWAWDDWWGDYYWVPGTWVMAPPPEEAGTATPGAALTGRAWAGPAARPIPRTAAERPAITR